MTIPKRIFYVWGANESKRPDVEWCIKSWEKTLPDYEIIEINENNTDFFNFEEELEKNKWFKTVYDRKLHAYVSDFIRIKTLYNNGGIYLDTDVTTIKPFDEFLNEPAFVGLQTDKKYPNDFVEPAVLGAEKGNAFLKQVMDFYDDEIWKRQIYRIPTIFGYLLKRNYGDFPNEIREKQKIVRYDTISVYPEKVFIPFRYNEMFVPSCIKKETCTIHWFGGSWAKPEVMFFMENKHKIPIENIDAEYVKYYKKKLKKNKLSFLQKIFSVKNEYKQNEKYKVITILGIKILFEVSTSI